jgi:redox-sensitive bicupin YhaK (pirin superfamily)
MSGPLQVDDVQPEAQTSTPERAPIIEITPSREARVDGQTVRRALPFKHRRTVGAWCFADHMGPEVVDGGPGLGIGPHPHIGLQTVTWLFAGEILHRDSLGSEQRIRPGQLNLMTAGNGVSHAEESPASFTGELHAMQLWVAQPERTRHGAAAFEHHADLPRVAFDNALATVMIGDFAGQRSPARRDTEHAGVEIVLRAGRSVAPLRRDFEYAIVLAEGAVALGADVVTPGHLAYLGQGRSELVIEAERDTRLLLLGGVPFESPVFMWWNFVARNRDEVEAAAANWNADDGRFGSVRSELARIPAPAIPWRAGRS